MIDGRDEIDREFLWNFCDSFEETFFLLFDQISFCGSSLPYLIMRFIIYAIYAKRNSRSRILGHRISRI